jgi:hypothetical protein
VGARWKFSVAMPVLPFSGLACAACVGSAGMGGIDDRKRGIEEAFHDVCGRRGRL